VIPLQAWVVGQGGLLGGALRKALERRPGVFSLPPSMRIAWDNESAAREAIAGAVTSFAERARAQGAPYALFWAAGVGVIGSTAAEMAAELQLWSFLLDQVERRLSGHPGVVTLASSAGGVFGGTYDQPLTERSASRPLSEYGRAKLKEELLLAGWAGRNPEVRCLVARISNLYGPGQDLRKPQGFISLLCKHALWRVPLHVYVPLDTIRDFIYAEDAAEIIASATLRVVASVQPAVVLKIIASEQPTSLARVVNTMRAVSGGAPTVLCGHSRLTSMQPGCLTFRSEVLRDLDVGHPTDLVSGIARTYEHCLRLYQQGELRPAASRW
jgi:UDP-glucose 4-epimerase